MDERIHVHVALGLTENIISYRRSGKDYGFNDSANLDHCTDVDPKFLFGLLFPDPHSKATVGEVKCDDGGSFFSL